MRTIRFILLVVVLLVCGVIALPFVVPPQVVTDQIVRITKQQTGRDLELGGDVSFTVYPDLGVSMSDITVSNPPDMPEGVLVAADTLRISLALMPLLKGDVQVRTFELVGPRFNLLTDGDGRSNWEFAGAQDTDGRGDRTDAPGGGSGAATLRSVSLDDIRIVDGVVRYLDEISGTALELTQVNVSVSLPSLDGELALDGSVQWQGDTVNVATALGPVSQFTTDKSADLRLHLSGTHLQARYEGAISLADGLALQGDLDASAPSLRALAQWTGTPLAPGSGLENFSTKARLDMVDDTISLEDAQIELDGMRAQGNVTVQTGGVRPHIIASLGVDQLDINRYLSGSEGGGAGGGAQEPQGWSDAPVDFSGLRALDAELRLAAHKVLYEEVVTGEVLANVTINGGRLDAQLEKLTLYGGSATGFIRLAEQDNTAMITVGLDAQNIAAHPFLNDLADFDWIEGTSRMRLEATATGNSQRAFVSSLAGDADLLFTDGAIRGINIAAMMRDMTSQIFNGWEHSQAQKTDFAELSATYQISQGLAINNDLRMLGPLVRLTGAGTVGLPNRHLDYRVDPKLVASLEGQGGAEDLSGFNVPIIVKGPWSNPDIYPDLAGILQNPEEALRQLEMIGGVAPGTVEDTLNEVVGEDAAGQIGDAVEDVLGDEGTEALDGFLQGLTGGGD